jgi:hypothetical protein
MNASVKYLLMLLFVLVCVALKVTADTSTSVLMDSNPDYDEGLNAPKSKLPTLWRIRAMSNEDDYIQSGENENDILYEDDLSIFKKRSSANMDAGIVWPPMLPISNAMMLSDERKRSIEKALSMNLNEKQMRDNLAKFFSPSMLKKMLQVVHAKAPSESVGSARQIAHDTSTAANTANTATESAETQQNQYKSYGNLLHMFHRFG